MISVSEEPSQAGCEPHRIANNETLSVDLRTGTVNARAASSTYSALLLQTHQESQQYLPESMQEVYLNGSQEEFAHHGQCRTGSTI